MGHKYAMLVVLRQTSQQHPQQRQVRRQAIVVARSNMYPTECTQLTHFIMQIPHVCHYWYLSSLVLDHERRCIDAVVAAERFDPTRP
jgi:hypothetical protein